MVAGEVGNHSRHSAYSTLQLAPTTSLATITTWEGTQCGFPCPFFRVGDRSPQRAHVLSLMPSVKEARMGIRTGG